MAMSAAGTSPAFEQPSRPVEAVLWMLLTTVVFAATNVVVHYQGEAVPLIEGVFIRQVWGLLFVIPGLIEVSRTRYPRAAWSMFCLRGVIQTAAVLLWFFAMASTPMADVTAISYLTPIVVTVGGALLLGERFALRRGIAICIALIGALVILRPGMREILPGHLAELGAALCFGLSYLGVKRLTAFASAQAIVAMMTLMGAIILAPVALLHWQSIHWVQAFWLGVTAFLATIGQLTMTKALAAAPVSVTQPVMFTQLIWVALAGLILFGEAIDPWVIVGGGMILTAVSYVTLREAALKRRATPLAGSRL